jgi:hypothetical protein
MTPLTSRGKWAPSSSAASPPRDTPATSRWPGSLRAGRAAAQGRR